MIVNLKKYCSWSTRLCVNVLDIFRAEGLCFMFCGGMGADGMGDCFSLFGLL